MNYIKFLIIYFICSNRENFLKNNLEISSTPPSPKDKKKISDRSVSLIDDSIIITEKVNDLITSDDSFINNDFSEITTSTPKKDNKINRNDNLFSNSPINQNNILIHNNQCNYYHYHFHYYCCYFK